MSEAKFKLTSVCGCGWASDQPAVACVNCGQAICPQCGDHAMAVAAWPGESHRTLVRRIRRHVVDVMASVEAGMEDERDGARH